MSTKFRSLTSRIDYDAFKGRSPTHRDWDAHRSACRSVPRTAVGFRGCIGLGLVVDHAAVDDALEWGGAVLVRNAAVRWLSIVDVPNGHVRTGHPTRAHAHWAVARRSVSALGMPSLSGGAEDVAVDFLSFPFDRATVVNDRGRAVEIRPPRHTLDPVAYPQLFRAFTAMEWAMTSYAAAYLPAWRQARPHLARRCGLQRYPDDIEVVRCGGGVYAGAASPDAWMPTAYVGVGDAALPGLFRLAARAGGRAGFPPAFVAALAEATTRHLAYTAPFDATVASVSRVADEAGGEVVEVRLAGDRGESAAPRFSPERLTMFVRAGEHVSCGKVVAAEPWLRGAASARWDHADARERQAVVRELFPGGLARHHAVRLWFYRQGVSVTPGLTHFPSSLVSAAAAAAAADDILWDAGSPEYFCDHCDCYVFPPIPIRKWTGFAGRLPGDVPYDFTPRTELYVSPADRQGRAGDGPPRQKRRRGPGSRARG